VHGLAVRMACILLRVVNNMCTVVGGTEVACRGAQPVSMGLELMQAMCLNTWPACV